MAGSVGTAYLTLVPKLDDGGLKDAETQFKGSGAASGDGFAAGLSSALKKIAGLAIVAKTAQAAGDTFKNAFQQAASYEQLAGGVETLFKDSAGQLMTYANDAYRTAGISANTYMEQATSFSASLISSLGGDTRKAAEYANMAMIDMSDNANKMGTDISAIQNAYQGFAKQNYTMLDNLKLGYGGTKEEMQRLLEDAGKIAGVKFNIDSYADVIQAIHVMQESMDIAGTTVKEGATTVEGSINMLKASWANFLTGMGSGADMATLAGQLVDSFTAAVSNVVPLTIKVFQGLVTALPGAISQLVPVLTTGIMNLIAVLPTLIPALITAGVTLFVSLCESLDSIIPQLLTMLPDLVQQVCNALIANMPLLLTAAVTLFLALTQAVIQITPQLINMLPPLVGQVISMLIRQIPTLLAGATTLFMSIAQAVPGVVGSVLAAVGSLVGQIPGHITSFVGAVTSAAGNLIQGMVAGLNPGAVLAKIRSICASAVDAIKSFFGIHSPSRLMRELFGYVGDGMVLGLEDSEKDVNRAVDNLIDDTYSAFGGINASVGIGGPGGTYNFNGITINAKDRTVDEMMAELVSYANRSRTMLGVA